MLSSYCLSDNGWGGGGWAGKESKVARRSSIGIMQIKDSDPDRLRPSAVDTMYELGRSALGLADTRHVASRVTPQ
jgi:hypothetical protein